MGKINVLDKYVAELIAAGEVVERPSSVVKEIIENSIDAGATSIEVEIKNGGISFIRITDNGHGILREDVPKAFLRHATSKVKDTDDLDKIMTLGFRGEALASIAAVSKVDVITKTESELAGIHYQIQGSQETLIEDIGCPKGTTITVRDLFYNTPARMKFLKKDVSEANAVAAVVDRVALSHPEISFKFIRNSKEELNTPGDGNIKSCIYSVYGKQFCDGLIPVDYETDGVKVTGFTSDTNSARPNRRMQHFFINARYVKSKTMMVALEQAFKGSIMTGKFPSCVLYLELSAEVVDVNVHPAKIEVRFINEKPIFDAVYRGVKTAIISNNRQIEMSLNSVKNQDIKNILDENQFEISNYTSYKPQAEKKPVVNVPDDKFEPDVSVPAKTVNYSSFSRLDDYSSSVDLYKSGRKKDTTSNSTLQPEKSDFILDSLREGSLKHHSDFETVNTSKINEYKPVKNEKPQVQEKIEVEPISLLKDVNPINLVGEIFNTYVVLEKNKESLILIDKHAAHERIIYEKLKKESGEAFSQYLLSPITVALDKNEYSAVLSNLSLLKKSGFEIDDFGSGTVIVRSAPLYLEKDDISNSVIEIAGHLLDNKSNISTEYLDWLYHNVACRAAIKAGDKSNNEELLALVKKLEDNPELRHCPHGRPIYVSITKREIEKQFGRV